MIGYGVRDTFCKRSSSPPHVLRGRVRAPLPRSWSTKIPWKIQHFRRIRNTFFDRWGQSSGRRLHGVSFLPRKDQSIPAKNQILAKRGRGGVRVGVAWAIRRSTPTQGWADEFERGVFCQILLRFIAVRRVGRTRPPFAVMGRPNGGRVRPPYGSCRLAVAVCANKTCPWPHRRFQRKNRHIHQPTPGLPPIKSAGTLLPLSTWGGGNSSPQVSRTLGYGLRLGRGLWSVKLSARYGIGSNSGRRGKPEEAGDCPADLQLDRGGGKAG